MENDKSGLTLNVSHFRAVERAEIDLETITVLAGVNACGKSTLAHLFHSLVNLNARYQQSLVDYSWRKISFLIGSVCELRSQIEHVGEMQSAYATYASRSRFDSRIHAEPFEYVLAEVNRFQRETLEMCRAKLDDESISRAYAAFLRAIDVADCPEKALDEQISATLSFYRHALEERDYGVFLSGNKFSHDRLLESGDVSFSENGSVVYATAFDKQQNTTKIVAPLKMLYGVSRAIYIESPWRSMPDIPEDGRFDFHDGFSSINTNADFKPDDTLFQVLSGRVETVKQTDDSYFARILGSKESYKWEYARKDGRTFDLSECATGIKALSILNVLYTRGLLDSKTLLIIDEPEVHLHPQWIGEYARILVLIAKRLKVRMLLTSHSPDMISALRTVSKAEEVCGVRFYLADAERPEDPDSYVYRNLGMDVGPIFKAFNKVMDWMDTYVPSTVSASR